MSGSKYVPPHLRKSQGGGGSNSNGGSPDGQAPRAGYGSSRGGGGGDRYGRNSSYRSDRGSYGEGRRSYNDRRSSGGPGPDGGEGGGPPPPQQTNSRWNNVDVSSDGRGSYHDGRNNQRGSYSSGGYGRRDSTTNKRGYHGDMRPDKRLERELFEREDRQTTGINFDRYDNIPVETSGNNVPDFIETYDADTIGEDLFRNTQLCGYNRPTPVQKYSIPIGSEGRDLMACAQTGSGKTAGFLFPIIMTMLKHGPRGNVPPNARRRSYPEALVLAPTRELASQIQDEARKFTYCTGIASVVVYGGAEIREQMRQIDRGCDLLVATPGRLVDLIERGRLAMDNIHFLVLDEADRMLDMGFEPQIRRIVEQENMPNEMRQTMMFSATFPPNIQRLASDFLEDYIFLTVGRVGSASKDVTQAVEYAEEADKLGRLMKFLLTIEEGLILIFVETKRSCDYIENVLCSKGFPACSIHGDKSQREREDALRSFKGGHTPVMVATDVASRGLDIPNVTQVVNYDLPSNIDDYVHRIGRTGRAGNTGAALSFVNEKNSGIVRELYELLEENDQETPSWLRSMCAYGGRGGGGRRGGGNRNSFGGRDYRTQDGQRFGGNRGGGGGGDGGGHYGGGGGGGYGGRGGGYGGGYGGGGYGGGGGGYGGGGYGGGGGSFGGGRDAW